MKRRTARRSAERGVALIIAIFTLMLISVVATALILMAGTQAAMKGNYKSSMQAFYDAKAGLEEGRSRLWPSNPNANALTQCLAASGSPIPAGQVCYITNPDPTTAEVVDPTDLSAGNLYADREYKDEYGGAVTSASVGKPFVPSTSPIANPAIDGPLYKWVRVAPRVRPADQAPLFYDGSNTDANPTMAQVLTVTALAVTPSGSRRMLQYTVAPKILFAPSAPVLPAAVTLNGNGVSFCPSGCSSLVVNGNDSSTNSGGVSAVGFTNTNDATKINATPASNYQSPPSVPSVGQVTLPTALDTPSGLDALVQQITQNANAVIQSPAASPANQDSLPAMSMTNPAVVVVNGDFHLSHDKNLLGGCQGSGNCSFTGYGMLVVTGTLYYDPDDSWYGLILVLGKGVFTNGGQSGKGGQINGAILVANTRDSSGNLLATLGPASFTQTGGGNGIQYSSFWVNSAQAMLPYQVLSFREIAEGP